jgi:hypothetical protein
LWFEHFKNSSEKEVNDLLGSLSSMKVFEWYNKLSKLLKLSQILKIKTWT